MKILTLLIAASFSLCIFGCSSASGPAANVKSANNSQAGNSAVQTNSSTPGKGKTESSLTGAIAGTWQMPADKDSTLTFDKDGSFISKDASGADKGTYSVIDDETIQIKSEKMPPDTKMKIKVTGDNLEMTMEGMEPMVLKRTK